MTGQVSKLMLNQMARLLRSNHNVSPLSGAFYYRNIATDIVFNTFKIISLS